MKGFAIVSKKSGNMVVWDEFCSSYLIFKKIEDAERLIKTSKRWQSDRDKYIIREIEIFQTGK